jgi:hypothetical protein
MGETINFISILFNLFLCGALNFGQKLNFIFFFFLNRILLLEKTVRSNVFVSLVKFSGVGTFLCPPPLQIVIPWKFST